MEVITKKGSRSTLRCSECWKSVDIAVRLDIGLENVNVLVCLECLELAVEKLYDALNSPPVVEGYCNPTNDSAYYCSSRKDKT